MIHYYLNYCHQFKQMHDILHSLKLNLEDISAGCLPACGLRLKVLKHIELY